MNPLLIESVARQKATSQSATKSTQVVVRVAPRQRRFLNRLGEELITLGTKLAFSRVDTSYAGMRQSW